MKAVLMVVAASCQGYALHSQEFNTNTFVLPKNSAAGRNKLADPHYQQLTRDVADVASHHTDEILDASIEAINSLAKNGVQGVAGENSFQQLSAELKHSLSAKTFESDGSYVGMEVRLEAKEPFGPGVDFLLFGAFKGGASKFCVGVAGGSEYNMKNPYGTPDHGEEVEFMVIAGGIHYDDLPTEFGPALPFLEYGGEVEMDVAPAHADIPLKVDGLAANKLDATRETFLAGVEINIPMQKVMDKFMHRTHKLTMGNLLQVDESNPMDFAHPPMEAAKATMETVKSKVTEAKHMFEENVMKFHGLDAELNAGGIFCKETKA